LLDYFFLFVCDFNDIANIEIDAVEITHGEI
jgi:hypothetical protein